MRDMKSMLADADGVTVARTRQDEGFCDMLKADDRLMRLAGIQLFDKINR